MKTQSLCLLVMVLTTTAAGAAWAQEPTLRIGLADSVSEDTIASSVSSVVLDARGHAVASTRPMEAVRALREGRGIALYGSTGKVLVTALPLRLVPRSMAGAVALVYAEHRWYRGEVALRAAGARMTVINEVPLEQYLYGVVPAEMNPRWPTESLKAQAVAARTYALAKRGQFGARGYDLRPTTENQVYRGASVETYATNAAVDQTRGQVLTYDGRIIPAYFESCSGGYTETSAAVWGEPHPYLQAVPDFDQESPSYTWQKNVGEPALRLGLARHGVHVGPLLRFDVLARSYSGRVQRIRVVGTEGSQDVSGDTVRQAAGLYSTLYNVLAYGTAGAHPAAFAFAGRGHGHGLGLSQWGAKGLAERGYAYTQILAYYYPTTQLSSVSQGGAP